MNLESEFGYQLIQLPRKTNIGWSVTAVENHMHLPFKVRRLYFLYDVPAEKQRGGHAHKKLEQLIVAVKGSVDVLLDDGQTKKKIRLDQPDVGLYIRPGVWRKLYNFSCGTVCVILASHLYDPEDYIRDYEIFKS